MRFSETAEDMHALAAEHDERYEEEREPNPEWQDFLQEREDKYLDSFFESRFESEWDVWLGETPRGLRKPPRTLS